MKRSIVLCLVLVLCCAVWLVSCSKDEKGGDSQQQTTGQEIPDCAGGHTVVIDEAVAPTCTKDGKTEGSHCSVCKEILVAPVKVAALGHTEVVDPAVEPTCTVDGKTEGTRCSVCNTVLIAGTPIPAAHVEVIDAAVAPTCTQVGLTKGRHCRVCNEVFVAQTEVPMVDHTPDPNNGTVCKDCKCSLPGLYDQNNHLLASWDTLVTTHDLDISKNYNQDSYLKDVRSPYYILTNKFSGGVNLVLPDTVTTIGEYAFYNCEHLTGIRIPESVTKIGKDAFTNCKKLIQTQDSVCYVDNWAIDAKSPGSNKLSKITFRNDTVGIGDYAFENGGWISSFTLHDQIIHIGEFAFAECKNLEKITFGKNVKTVGTDAFLKCSYLKEITLPEGLTRIEDYTFYGCERLTKVVIPSTVTEIGQEAFSNCLRLTDINIPASVTKIGTGAFFLCHGITSISISKNLTTIETGAFRACENIASITVDPENPKYHSTDNCLIDTEAKLMIAGCKNSIIPADGSVTSLDEHLFAYMGTLTSIQIPSCITTVGIGAFEGCYSLAGKLYDNAVYLGNEENPYLYLLSTTGTYITSVNIHESTRWIESYAFDGCTSLKTVTFSDNITSIGTYAFSDCASLTNITLPKNLTHIGDFAFAFCYNMKTVTFSDQLVSIGAYAFQDCANLTNVKIPKSVTYIGENAFFECVKAIETEDKVFYVGNWAIGCERTATNATLREDTVGIAALAFAFREDLVMISIPNTVTTICESAFEECPTLARIVIGKGVKTIEKSVLKNCDSLAQIYYAGTSEKWDTIDIDPENDKITSVTRYYYSEDKPTAGGRYWHYVNKIPTPW